MSLPISTMSQPRCRLGIVSDIRAKVIGSMPPTPMPMTKQVTRFIQYAGMVPQVDVATKMTAESMIEARRQIRSPSQPHASEPTVVPEMPASGYSATGSAWACGLSGPRRPYSAAEPGAMKARVVVFMTSMVIAAASTSSRATCARLRDVSSSARTWILLNASSGTRRGDSDHRVSPTPTNSSTIPRSMYQVIAMPARWKCMSRAIQYMGNCNTTPVVVVRMPAQKPTGCSYDTPLARRPENAGHDRGLLPGESDEVTGCLLAWVGGATDAGERSGTMRSGTEAGRPRISTGSSTRPEEGMTAGINRTILGVPARRP